MAMCIVPCRPVSGSPDASAQAIPVPPWDPWSYRHFLRACIRWSFWSRSTRQETHYHGALHSNWTANRRDVLFVHKGQCRHAATLERKVIAAVMMRVHCCLQKTAMLGKKVSWFCTSDSHSNRLAEQKCSLEAPTCHISLHCSADLCPTLLQACLQIVCRCRERNTQHCSNW